MGYIFVVYSKWVAMQIFKQFCLKTRNVNILDAEPETDSMQNGHSGSLQVIYFGVTEEPLRDYIVQYNNNCGLRCEGSEDIVSERSKNIHFRRPLSNLMPLSGKPPRISE